MYKTDTPVDRNTDRIIFFLLAFDGQGVCVEPRLFRNAETLRTASAPLPRFSVLRLYIRQQQKIRVRRLPLNYAYKICFKPYPDTGLCFTANAAGNKKTTRIFPARVVFSIYFCLSQILQFHLSSLQRTTFPSFRVAGTSITLWLEEPLNLAS